MKRAFWTGMLGAVTLVATPAAPAPGATPCTVEALRSDVASTLVGSVEVSTLRVAWSTDNEGRDLRGYELWARLGARADRLAEIASLGSCPVSMRREARVPYDPQRQYYLELRLSDGTILAIPVPVR